MTTLKIKKAINRALLTLAIISFVFVGRTFAASSITLNPSSGVIPAEGLYVDVVVENALDSGIEFTFNWSGNVTVKDVHDTFSSSKKYVYSPNVIALDKGFKVLATNLSGSTSTYTTSGVVTTFLVTAQSNINDAVTLSIADVAESNLVVINSPYTYTVGNSTVQTQSGGVTAETPVTTTTTVATGGSDLPQTFLSSKSLLIIGFSLLVAGELFGLAFNPVRSLLRKIKGN